MKILCIVIFTLLTSCTGIPEGITAVDGFDVNRYLGTWYEIARLDHRFERGLENISATYTLREDGGIDVLNKGWDVKAGKWQEAQGKAYFVEQPDKGRLKVSFFGPFYGGYNIIDLDKKDYAYSMVTGPDRSYLWILSRTRQLPEATLQALLERAKALGFATDQLIFVKHD
ncbi:MAG: lipocalin family protein [Methylobacter sp.]|uniref:lipocalin family protein n=1 Tax=Methylobacter sp. TaxID=2051955 RepID=UPI0025FE881F|nr:lipocalin family protein [Methylobacter sp.]MCK9621010.1 lipocalin family protein [Methylobacter sp.]